MAFTRRHYNEVARIIREELTQHRADMGPAFAGSAAEVAVWNIQNALCRMFAADNPRFDGTRFDLACEPRSKK